MHLMFIFFNTITWIVCLINNVFVEGNVFYSNQEYLNNVDDDEAPNIRSRASAAFRDFLRNFKDVSPDDANGDLAIETCIYR